MFLQNLIYQTILVIVLILIIILFKIPADGIEIKTIQNLIFANLVTNLLVKNKNLDLIYCHSQVTVKMI